MSHPFKLTFTLKQHTPIIHFQHEQEGATLRASEVKPKLDRFIIEELPYLDENLAVKYSRTLARIKDVILNQAPSPYRIQIKSLNPKPKYYLFLPQKKVNEISIGTKRKLCNSLSIGDINSLHVISDSAFFANSDKFKFNKEINDFDISPDIRLALFDNAPIEVEFYFKDLSLGLKDIINYCFPKLLSYENFGMRQSKGFGSFGIEGQKFDEFAENFELRYNDCYEFDRLSSWEVAFKRINSIWKNLKNDSATKQSLVRDYYKKRNIEWEKELIRKRLVLHSSPKDEIAPANYKYVRALLGLAELFDYPQDKNQKVKVIDPTGEILRFRSPIIFKYFSDKLLVGIKEIPDEMFDRDFVFYKGDSFEHSTHKLKIKTPACIELNSILDHNISKL